MGNVERGYELIRELNETTLMDGYVLPEMHLVS